MLLSVAARLSPAQLAALTSVDPDRLDGLLGAGAQVATVADAPNLIAGDDERSGEGVPRPVVGQCALLAPVTV